MFSSYFLKQKPHLLPIAVLIIATFVGYAGILNHDFLSNWDDQLYVTWNETIRGFTFEHLKDAFTRFYIGNYAPIHIISYILDYSIWGLNPAGFLFTNILIHAGNVLLFYALMIRNSVSTGIAFLAGYIFALHPVQVESVAWVSERKNLLSMFFFLLAFHCYIAYRQNRKYGKIAYAGSVMFLVTSLLSKPVSVIFPVVLILYDMCFPGCDGKRGKISDKLPFLAASLAIMVVTYLSQSPQHHGGRAEYHGGSPWFTFLTMLPVLTRYIKILFLPTDLSVGYYLPVATGITPGVILSFLAVVALIILGGFFFVKKRPLFFWYALFFIGLLPVSQIVPLITLMHDRYLYFPMLGAAAIGAQALSIVCIPSVSGFRAIAPIAILLPLLSLPWMSRQRAETWRNSVTLWSDTVHKMPDAPFAWTGLGSAHLNSNEREKALASYAKALDFEPDNGKALVNIGLIHCDAGEFGQAEPYLTKMVVTNPDDSWGHVAMGILDFQKGEMEQAEAACSRALTLSPADAGAWLLLGNIYFKRGRTVAGRNFYVKALQYANLTYEREMCQCFLDAANGKVRPALEQMQALVRRKPDGPPIIMGSLYLKMMQRLFAEDKSFNQV
ncbi:MAG: tetratricopeptide repeat protein [Geobacter sp.]|nr:tetratricopeptide repeat protein [Geobacter sp.]